MNMNEDDFSFIAKKATLKYFPIWKTSSNYGNPAWKSENICNILGDILIDVLWGIVLKIIIKVFGENNVVIKKDWSD